MAVHKPLLGGRCFGCVVLLLLVVRATPLSPALMSTAARKRCGVFYLPLEHNEACFCKGSATGFHLSLRAASAELEPLYHYCRTSVTLFPSNLSPNRGCNVATPLEPGKEHGTLFLGPEYLEFDY